MDYYSNFQKVIDYIEQNLTEEIDYKILAQILGTNEQFLQVIFTFITNTSLTEYIKKRRFSRAYEELKSTNIRVIDLAIKYQIFIEGTSLFAEIESDEKISDKMKSEILGHPETH